MTMLLSGPAGGVTGAVWMAEQSGHRDLLTFDMGGTSTDVALVQGLQAADRPGDQGRRPDRPGVQRWTCARSAPAADRSRTCPS